MIIHLDFLWFQSCRLIIIKIAILLLPYGNNVFNEVIKMYIMYIYKLDRSITQYVCIGSIHSLEIRSVTTTIRQLSNMKDKKQ